ncbi:MAG: prepilin-type N-terminal cleavage/methylation domain-containing protein [Anaerosomatales bacterium]|nr:prepilin-type N-terminal cleavage/methylation domain-containing protein [Anaerosomatales bacterium]
MHRGQTRYPAHDEGMTLIEVVVAIAIFFFVLTAIFGLLGATTSMSVLSNERALLVNAINSYIEEVRAMSYTDVGVDVVAAPVPGTLSVESTQTSGGYAIALRPTVTWVDDPDITPGTQDYKQLTVDGTISRRGEVVYSLSMSTYIRQEAPPGEYTRPTIRFGPQSPAEESPPALVRGRTVLIDAIAESTMPGARLVSMSFQVSPGGIYLRDQAGNSAIWELDSTTATKQFYWDTMALNEDGLPFVEDGEYTITVEVVDSNQKRVYQTRRVFIDNDPPDPPTNLVANALLSGTQVPMTWTTSMDGRSESDHYVLLVGAQARDGSWTENEIVTSGPAGLHTLATQPFTRYATRVAAESRGSASDPARRSYWHPSEDVGEDPVRFTTRPLLSGTYDGQYERAAKVKAWDVNIDLEVGRPTFTEYNVTYILMQKIGAGAWAELQRNTTGIFDFDITVPANNANALTVDYRYKAVVYYTEEPYSEYLMLETNTLGPLSVPTTGAREFASPGVW